MFGISFINGSEVVLLLSKYSQNLVFFLLSKLIFFCIKNIRKNFLKDITKNDEFIDWYLVLYEVYLGIKYFFSLFPFKYRTGIQKPMETSVPIN